MIRIDQLQFRYGSRPVFTGLSLNLHPGYIYGLLGKNGTGKSTLLRVIGGLLFPDGGQITVNGFVPGKRQPAFLEQIFTVPEEFYFPDASIDQFVAANAPFYPAYDNAQFERYLLEFAVPRNLSLKAMSYGQKKKTLISFGLACNTPILLMDEPTNGLDIMSKSQFRKVIAGALSENKCILISTHQVKDLEKLIDRVTVIDEGTILFDQTIDSIGNNLQFGLSFTKEEMDETIYAESSIRGYAFVSRNQSGQEGNIDLEMLYKAIVTDAPAVQAAFQQ